MSVSTQIQGVPKGATTAGQVTATAIDVDHTALDVKLQGATLDTSAIAGAVEVETFSIVKVVSITPDALIYAGGDLIGGKNTVNNIVRESGKGAVLQSVVVADYAKQNSALTLFFWGQDPSTTTFTDQAPFDIADADLLTCAGHVAVSAGDYVSLADNSLASVRNIGLVLVPSVTTLYMAVMCGGTPTYGAASMLQIKLGFLQD